MQPIKQMEVFTEMSSTTFPATTSFFLLPQSIIACTILHLCFALKMEGLPQVYLLLEFFQLWDAGFRDPISAKNILHSVRV